MALHPRPRLPARSKATTSRGFATDRTARRALESAAEAGDPQAQFNLGVFCSNRNQDARGIDSDRRDAFAWLSRAAHQGLGRAQHKLADLYAAEVTGPGAQVKSCAWLLIAATCSSGVHRDRAEEAFERMSSRLTAPQLALAKRLARAWRPKPHDQPIGAAAAKAYDS
jgi:TPR repeat protein